MSITIAGTAFDRIRYDRDADVLYLHDGDPARAVAFDESAEGHGLRFDGAGRLVGITVVGAKRLLDEGVPLTLTVPSRLEIDAQELAAAVRSAV